MNKKKAKSEKGQEGNQTGRQNKGSTNMLAELSQLVLQRQIHAIATSLEWLLLRDVGLKFKQNEKTDKTWKR